jgi:hypothetical protein
MKKYIGFSCVAFCLFFGAAQSNASNACTATVGNLVSNCGFETGTFSGWTLSGNDVPQTLGSIYGVEGVDPFDGTSPNDGSFQAYFGDLVANSTTLSQSISTIATDSYSISFYLAQDTPVGTQPTESNAFSASFGGVTLDNLTAVPVEGYTKLSFNVTATSSSSLLSLKLGNDLGEFLLDDVTVVQNLPVTISPEPPAWTFMFASMMGLGLLWKRGVVTLRPQDTV